MEIRVRDLRKAVPGVRVIVAGRAVPAELTRGRAARQLSGIGEADAIHLLRLLAPSEDERVLAEIARRVEGNPLSLHLAADVLRRTGTSPVRMLALGEGNVQGQLYARLLEHIRDPKVRAIAHPGLVVRRITAEVIREVLAEPCGIAPLDINEAELLFWSLRQEATLCEPSPDGDNSLVHRQDVRAIMLPAIQQDSPGTTAKIHEAAVRYYSSQTSPGSSDLEQRVMRREELYHRLMLKDERHVLDDRWTEEAGRELAHVVEELPKPSQAYLVSRVQGLRLDPAVRAAADDDEWCHSVRPAAEAQLERHLVAEALELVRERRGADGRSLLPDLEIEALERLGRVDEALALATAEYENAVRRGSHRATREMLTHQARILERMRRWNEAAAILAELAQLDRERRARTNRLDEEVRTRELVVLTSLLRIARHQGRGDVQTDALVAETVELAEATPPRTLVRTPSLLRDLGAEIGRRSPTILALATSTLAGTSRVTNLMANARRQFEHPGAGSPPPTSPDNDADGLADPSEAPEDSDWSGRFAADSDSSQSYLSGRDYPAGTNDPNTLTARTSLADLLQAQDRLEEAESVERCDGGEPARAGPAGPGEGAGQPGRAGGDPSAPATSPDVGGRNATWWPAIGNHTPLGQGRRNPVTADPTGSEEPEGWQRRISHHVGSLVASPLAAAVGVVAAVAQVIDYLQDEKAGLVGLVVAAFASVVCITIGWRHRGTFRNRLASAEWPDYIIYGSAVIGAVSVTAAAAIVVLSGSADATSAGPPPPASTSSAPTPPTPSASPSPAPTSTSMVPPLAPPPPCDASTRTTAPPNGCLASVSRSDDEPTTVYQQPSRGSTVITRVQDDSKVTIRCTAIAERVTDNGSTSALWNKIDEGWISDTSTNTGQVVAVMPTCPGN